MVGMWFRSPGVEYADMPLLPGAVGFRCQQLSATLQVSTCAGMWREARAGSGRCQQCSGCAIGAGHAGVEDASRSSLLGRPMCSRCGRQDLRLIGGNVCVGCKNREYEWVKGRNAKGKPPVCQPPLERRRVTFSRGSAVEVLARERTVSTAELVVELLRDSPTRVMFGLGVGRVYG